MAEESPIRNFLPLGRGYFEHFLWKEERVFSRAEAWLDLVRSSAYEPQKKLVKGEFVEVPRGGIVASERFLSNRWKWSRTKVRAFLDILEKESMIRPVKDHKNTVFLLCNYAKYNPQKNHKADQSKTGGEPVEDQIEEGKEREKDNISKPEGERPSAFPWLWELFPREVKTFTPMELSAYVLAIPHLQACTEADVAAIMRYYRKERAKGEKGRHRRDLAGFLAWFTTELDRATPKQSPKPAAPPAAEKALPDPEGWGEFIALNPELDGMHFAQVSQADQEKFKDWAFNETGRALKALRHAA